MPLNRKFRRRMTILLLGACVLASGSGGFYLWRMRHIRRQFQEFRNQGIAAARVGDNVKAIDLLHRYLIRYPDDVEALSTYARVRPLVEEPGGSQISETVLVLRHLLQLDPHRIDDRRYLLSLYIETRYATEALQTCDSLLPAAKTFGPEDVPALSGRTNALIWLNRFDQALVSARQWNAAAPTDADASLTLLYLLRRLQKPAQEIAQESARLVAHTRAALSKGATDPRPEMIEGYADELMDHRDEAVARLRIAASHVPPDAHTALLLINRLDAMGMADESLAVLDRTPQKNIDPEIRRQRARRLWEQGRWADVVQATQGLDASDPATDAELLALRALSLQSLARKIDAAPAALALRNRSKDPTIAAWSSIVDQPADAAGARRVSEACRLALATDPSNAYLGFFLGESLERIGESDLAVAAWRKSAEADPNWASPLTRAANVLSDAGRSAPAVQAAVEAHRRAPHDAMAAVALARAWAVSLQSDPSDTSGDLLQFATSIQEQDKGEPETLAIRIAILARTGHADKARDLLDQILRGKEPQSEGSLLRLESISRFYNLNLEDQCLSRCRQDHGDTPDLVCARAEAELRAGRAAEGVRLIDAARARSSDRGTLEWQLIRARYLQDAGDPAAATAFAELADQNPGNARAQLLTLAAPVVQSNKVLREKCIDRIRLCSGGHGLEWRIQRARWLLDFTTGESSDLEIASLLTEVMRQAPDLLETRLLMARAAERANKVADAIEHLSVAAELDSGSPGILLELSALQQQVGDFDRAGVRLEQAAALHGLDAPQLRRAADLFVRQGAPGRAIGLLEKSRQIAPLSASDGLFLAKLYRQTGDLDHAGDLCRELLKKPDVSVLEFAAELSMSRGQQAEADRLLTRLQELSAARGEKELALAAYAARYGDADAALKWYRAATGTAPQSPLTWQSLIGYCVAVGRTADANSAVAMARAAMPANPTIAAIVSRWPKLQQASRYPRVQSLALAFVRDPGASLAAADALELLLDARKAGRPLEQSISRLTELASQNPRLLSLQVVLAETEADTGRRDEAIEVATRAARNVPASPEPLRLSARLLAASGRWAEVAAVARTWRERSADDPVAADLALASARLHLGQAREAMEQLQPYADRAATSPQAQAQFDAVLPTYAAAAQESGSLSAQSLMEPLLSHGVQGRAAWMAFALDHLPPDQAAVWLKRVDPLIPADSTAERILLAQIWDTLSSRTHRAEFAAASRQVLTPLASRVDAPPSVLIAMGIRDEEDGNLPAAQTCYRRALSLQGDGAIARNNLAMVLTESGGDLREARALVADAIKAHPEIALFYDTLACVQGKLKDFDGAAGAMEVAVRLDTQNLKFRAHLAEAQLDGGHPEKAAASLKELDERRGASDRLSDDLRRQIDLIRQGVARAGERRASAR